MILLVDTATMAAASTAGNYGPGRTKIQQDRFALINDQAMCVCDGHGEQGELVSAAVADEFIQHCNSCDTSTLQSRVVARVERDVGAPTNQTSGSTLIGAYRKGNNLHVINVGDSRAIGLTRSGQTLALSRDHKPDDPVELANITAAGGRVSTRRNDVPRVGGLALSRAFGDLALASHGVTSNPDETVTQINVLDFVILASDGIWDVFTSAELSELWRSLHKTHSLAAACAEIVSMARRRWAEMTQSTYCDDITLAVWAFAPSGSKL